MEKNEGTICISSDGNILSVDKDGLLTLLKNNPDRNSVDIDAGLVKLIKRYYGSFSTKQSAWIFKKIGFIVRCNSKYFALRRFKDIRFL
jgi:hypothetical protein